MKKLIELFLCIAAMLICVYLIYNHYEYQVYNNNNNSITKDGKNNEFINKLRKDYGNNEIVMLLEIPGVFSIPVAQTDNNDYYLSHDIYKNDSNDGCPFLDYRIKSLNDRKLIIYGHDSVSRTLPFSDLKNYQNQEFFMKHKEIFIYTDEGEKVYKIFSSFNEDSDGDYLDLNGFTGMDYYEHLLKIKNKSLYDTNVSINDDSKVIVLRTSTGNQNQEGNIIYQVVVAVLSR